MTDIQKHLIKLLQEIDEICTQNDIPYILGGRTAKDACQSHHFLGDYAYATVLMLEKDLDKFRKLVAKKENRTTESFVENPDFPDGFTVRYVDESTTFIYGHLAHNYKYKGFYITIYPCRNIPGNKYKAKLANVFECAVLSGISGTPSGLGRKKMIIANGVRLMQKILGKDRTTRVLLKLRNRLIRTAGKNVALLRPGKKNLKLSRSMFTSLTRVEFEGVGLLVPSAFNRYLRTVFGTDWEKNTEGESLSSAHLLVASTEISYKEIDNDNTLYANRAEINSMILKRKKLMEQIKSLRGKIEKYWDFLFLAKARFSLYRRYVPIIQILQEYQEKRDYAILQIAMADYMEILKVYLSKNLPLSVTAELDQIALELLRYSGELEHAKKFKELQRQVPMKPVSVELDDNMRAEALRKLPPKISCTPDGNVPVFLRWSNRLYPVGSLTENGQFLPLFLKQDTAIVPAVSGVLAVQETDGTCSLLSDDVWHSRLFGSVHAIPLIQHIYGQDLEIAWLSETGCLYITAEVDSCGCYVRTELPEYLSVGHNGELALSFVDSKTDELYPVFCMDDDNKCTAMAAVGVGGCIWITPGASKKLYYRDRNGNAVRLSINHFTDCATAGVKATIAQSAPNICAKFVQRDIFGRLIEVAAMRDDGSIVPLVQRAQDGSLIKLDPSDHGYTTFYLKQACGIDAPLATVDAEGNVIHTAVQAGAILLSIITGSRNG